jgi:hypothetical protein
MRDVAEPQCLRAIHEFVPSIDDFVPSELEFGRDAHVNEAAEGAVDQRAGIKIGRDAERA